MLAEPVEKPELDSFHELEHELKTPLASIRAISEILLDYGDIPAAERNRMLEAMLEDQGRLARAVELVLRADQAMPLMLRISRASTG